MRFPTSVLLTGCLASSVRGLAIERDNSSPNVKKAIAGGKRGLAYEVGEFANLFAGNEKVTWGYSWGYTRQGLSPDFDFTPMLWGLPSDSAPGWEDAALADGVTHILGFNEPDLEGQADITLEQAVEGHRTFFEPYAGQVKIGSPAITNADAPDMGLNWMADFLEQCNDCTIDFVNIHWYANNNPEYFKEHVTAAHDLVQRPVWVTEFAAAGSEEEQIEFLENVLPWLDEQDFVERYAYFGVFPEFLLNESGDDLSELGKVYATA